MANPHSVVGKDGTLERLLAHRGEFLRFIEKRVDSRATAEDILQSAFLRGMKAASSLHSDESAVAWFYRLLRNSVIDYYRSRSSDQRLFGEWPDGFDVPGQPVEFVRNEVCRCVGSVVQDLKPEYAEALETVDIEEQPVERLAKKAGITTNNANVRVHRAREALKRRVQLVCGSCAKHGCVDCRCRRGVS